MKWMKRETYLVILSLIFLVIPILAQHEMPTNVTIDHPDAVVVKGNLLNKFHGYPIKNFRLYRYYSEKWEPIPFQIDERDSRGLLVLPQGTRPTFDDQSREIFDKNDELVFMSKDLGDRAEQSLWLKNSLIAAEIVVEDSLTGDKGWVYCLLFHQPPPLNSKDYVDLELEQDNCCVSTSHYTIAFHPSKIYCTKLVLKNNGNGEELNILDRTKFRTSVRLKWQIFYFLAIKSFSKNEEDVKLYITAYKDGPVRLILRGIPRVKLIMSWELPSEELDSIYYYNQIINTSLISSPANLSTYCSSANFRAGFDFKSNTTGMYFYNLNNPEPTKIDGKMDQQEQSLDLSHQNWMVLTGSQGTIISRVVLGSSLKKIRNKLYYCDNINLEDPPEAEKGHCPQIGYKYDLLPVKKGKHKLSNYLYFPSHFQPGDEVYYLNILDHPLKITVRH